MTFDLNISQGGLSRHFRSSSKVTDISHSLRSQEENVAKVVSTTSSEGFSSLELTDVRPVSKTFRKSNIWRC